MSTLWSRARPVWLLALAMLIAGAVPTWSHAASAVAFDSKTGAMGWSFNHASGPAADGAAIQQCLRNGGGDCAVSISCPGAGFGAIYTRPANGKVAWGASCGMQTAVAATMKARQQCETEVAISMKALPESARGAQLDWNFVLRRLQAVCPGLGNCRCGNRAGMWNDTRPGE